MCTSNAKKRFDTDNALLYSIAQSMHEVDGAKAYSFVIGFAIPKRELLLPIKRSCYDAH